MQHICIIMISTQLFSKLFKNHRALTDSTLQMPVREIFRLLDPDAGEKTTTSNLTDDFLDASREGSKKLQNL